MKKLLCIILISLSAINVRAQGDVEYLMEVGGGLGLMSYEGDYNGSIMRDLQPTVSLLLRRNINPYHGFRLNLGYGRMKGSSTDVETYYPGLAENPYTFSNMLVDLCATYEYNFWPYGTGRE